MNYNAQPNDAIAYIKKHGLSEVVDIGCGRRSAFAEVSSEGMDYQDYSNIYPGKRFTKHDISVQERLPYKDKQFHFSICSHVLEHMENPTFLLWELQRISSAGYIEVPLPLADNLLSIDGDQYGHKWWIEPGLRSTIVIRKRLRVVDNNLDFQDYTQLLQHFRSSLNAGFLWINSIEFEFIDPSAIPTYDSKLSRLALQTIHSVESNSALKLLRNLIRR
jgi:ubiquinone/menaquinone biosynthesis C-methylase UbiE